MWDPALAGLKMGLALNRVKIRLKPDPTSPKSG
jgi:hypothetical protein